MDGPTLARDSAHQMCEYPGVTYTKLNPHMCPLSDQKDFGICHNIKEKRCGTLLRWTRGHTVEKNVLRVKNKTDPE